MRLGAYIFLIFSISLVLYFMGYTSVLLELFGNQGSKPIVLLCSEAEVGEGCSGLINNMINAILNPTGMLAVVGLIVAVALITGFSAMYLIPLLLLIAILDFVVFPFSFILDPATLPPEFGIPIIVLFNLLTVMAITNFIRGGSV